MALGRWTVKVHPDRSEGRWPLGNRATVYTPEGNALFYAVDLAHGFTRAYVFATAQEEES